MGEEKFYSRFQDRRRAHEDHSEWKIRRNGCRIELVPWLSMFVYTTEDPGDLDGCGGPFDVYFVVEELSGCSFGRGLSEEEAVKNARGVLGNMGKEEALKRVTKQALSQDISPKFKSKMRKAITGWLKEIEEANS